MAKRNPLEALCILAVRQRWCWRIGCTTCGCGDFRRATLQLATTGKLSNEWWYREEPAIWTAFQQRVDRFLPGFTAPWSADVQQAFARKAAKARLPEIAMRAQTPGDWLGYLGLALYETAQTEQSSRALTNAWLPQLLEMCRYDTVEYPRLRAQFRAPDYVMRWEHLEVFESRLDAFHRYHRTPVPVTADDRPPPLRRRRADAKRENPAPPIQRGFLF